MNISQVGSYIDARLGARFTHDGDTYTLAEMMAFNGEIAEIRNWLMLAQVGESKDFGGGAVGEAIVRRVS